MRWPSMPPTIVKKKTASEDAGGYDEGSERVSKYYLGVYPLAQAQVQPLLQSGALGSNAP